MSLESPYLYLALMGFSLLVPLLRSFEKRIAFYKSFMALFPAIVWVGIPFILWDIWFTAIGVWGFNPRYLSGHYYFNLPLGEYLFFIVIPYCSVFVYRVCNYFIRQDLLASRHRNISRFLIGLSLTLAVMFYDRAYTFLTFSLLGLFLILHAEWWKTPWMGRFYLAFAFILIPFFAVNGILTGMGLQQEVVWYNDMENLGIRLITIPVEDVFYGMLLILGVISLYERLGRYLRLDFVQDSKTE